MIRGNAFLNIFYLYRNLRWCWDWKEADEKEFSRLLCHLKLDAPPLNFKTHPETIDYVVLCKQTMIQTTVNKQTITVRGEMRVRILAPTQTNQPSVKTAQDS